MPCSDTSGPEAWFQRGTCPKICSDYFVEISLCPLASSIVRSKKVPEHYLLELHSNVYTALYEEHSRFPPPGEVNAA